MDFSSACSRAPNCRCHAIATPCLVVPLAFRVTKSRQTSSVFTSVCSNCRFGLEDTEDLGTFGMSTLHESFLDLLLRPFYPVSLLLPFEILINHLSLSTNKEASCKRRQRKAYRSSLSSCLLFHALKHALMEYKLCILWFCRCSILMSLLWQSKSHAFSLKYSLLALFPWKMPRSSLLQRFFHHGRERGAQFPK